jgi:hypothetical protein
VRCPRCGNENSDTNRFCGMCGATLLPESAPAASGPAQGAATRTSAAPSSLPSAPAQSRTSAPVSEESPVISGPSFLGLNDPAPRNRAGLSADPHASSSRNLDYLLDDEEEHRHGGGGKFILILLALALAVGFGYLRWKNQGFGWLGSHTNKPSAATQSPEAPDTSSATPPASNSTSAPATPTAPQQPTPDPAAAAGSPAATSPAAASPAAASPAAASSGTNPATGTTPPNSAPGDAAGSSDASNSPADSAAAPPVPAAKEPAPAAREAAPAANPKPNKAADQPATKPHAAVKSTPAIDSVSEAQKYLYGRGVTQDCERGLRLLKPAANQSNPKAMIEMGALYSAGLCTPHDLPTAYRWFALALRKDPNNMAVQTDLQKLWGEMTQPERQLAIKLSQ